MRLLVPLDCSTFRRNSPATFALAESAAWMRRSIEQDTATSMYVTGAVGRRMWMLAIVRGSAIDCCSREVFVPFMIIASVSKKVMRSEMERKKNRHAICRQLGSEAAALSKW